MFSQAKIGYAGPSPPPVRLALRPVTPALSQRVRSLGDCSDRMALEKSETVHTNVEVVSPLLTKTTVVRRTVRSEYVRGGFLHYVFVTFFQVHRALRGFLQGGRQSQEIKQRILGGAAEQTGEELGARPESWQKP